MWVIFVGGASRGRQVAWVRTVGVGVPSPSTGREAEIRWQGCQSCEVGFITVFDRSATPHRKVRIESIKGILG